MTDVDDIRLVPDQAVPLSLLMTEALTNAIKHSVGTRAEPAVIDLRLKQEPEGMAVLEIINNLSVQGTVNTSDIDPMNTGLGTQLVTAFAQQLGGALEQGEVGGRYVMRLRFKQTPLAEAEDSSTEDLAEDPSGR